MDRRLGAYVSAFVFVSLTKNAAFSQPFAIIRCSDISALVVESFPKSLRVRSNAGTDIHLPRYEHEQYVVVARKDDRQ